MSVRNALYGHAYAGGAPKKARTGDKVDKTRNRQPGVSSQCLRRTHGGCAKLNCTCRCHDAPEDGGPR